VKRILTIIALCACALTAQAQGTFQLSATLSGANEVPPNNDPTVANGAFSLNGGSLSFYLEIPAITFISQTASIHGPALPGNNAPVIFDLGGPVFHGGSPQFAIPPSYVFFSPFDGTFGAGPFTLATSQINELVGGLWYVNVTSAQEPNGQIRGQIVSVPEPAVWTLLLIGSGIILLSQRRNPNRPARLVTIGLYLQD